MHVKRSCKPGSWPSLKNLVHALAEAVRVYQGLPAEKVGKDGPKEGSHDGKLGHDGKGGDETPRHPLQNHCTYRWISAMCCACAVPEVLVNRKGFWNRMDARSER